MKIKRPHDKTPGFHPVGPHQVFMDGKPLKHVIRVDTCAGVAWVLDSKEDGSIRVRNGEPVVRRLFGPMSASPILSEYP